MDDGTKENERDDQETRLYELGYHLLPTIEEESLGGEVSKIKDVVESNGGIIISEEPPKVFELAYPIAKMLSNKRKYFNSAFFGWIRFQGNPARAVSLHDVFLKDESLLRFILIKVEEERAAKPPRKMKFFSREKKPLIRKELPASSKKEELTEAELDKTIEELIAK